MDCVFPFKYEGKSYDSCITNGNGGTEWCATSLNSDGTYLDYGNCNCYNVKEPGKSFGINIAAHIWRYINSLSRFVINV